MEQIYDVVIIGGGIIGSSTCVHLAEKDLNIALINSPKSSPSATLASAGMIAPFQLNGNSFLRDFSLKSFEYFLTFYNKIKDNTNIDLGFRQPGSLFLILSNLEIAKKEFEIKESRKVDPKISFLNKQEVSKLEQNITKEIISAYHFPQEAFINNIKFLKAIQSYISNKKVTFINNEVIEINHSKEKVQSIKLDNGETIQAKKYLLTNGAWANKLLKETFNQDIIKAVKGEILEISVPRIPIQKIIFSSDGYIVPRPPTNQFEKPKILIGSTSEEVNIENPNASKNTIEGVSCLINLYKELLPNIKDSTISNLWAGFRPASSDGLPVIGKTTLENLYCGIGHYREGILWGPFTGKILAEIISEDTSEYNIEPFKFERFNRRDAPSERLYKTHTYS